MARNNNVTYSISCRKKQNRKSPYRTSVNPITARTQRIHRRNHLKSILPVLKQWLEAHHHIEAVATINSNGTVKITTYTNITITTMESVYIVLLNLSYHYKQNAP